MPAESIILTNLSDLADAWDEPQPIEPDAPASLPRSWGVPAPKKASLDGCLGRWENGAPRFFGIGPRKDRR